MIQRARRYAASRWGSTTSSKLLPIEAGDLHSPAVFIERSKDLLESACQRRVVEAEADAAQADVREHRIGEDLVGQDLSGEDPCCGFRKRPTAQRAIGKTGERRREVVQSDRVAVDDEIPAANLATLGEMDQRARAILDVNWRHPR